MRVKNTIDALLEKVISRKLMAWFVTLALVLLFAVFDWQIQDRLIDVFRDVTMMYIGTVGAIDAVKAFKGKPSFIGRLAEKFSADGPGDKDPDSEILDD